MKCPQSFPSEVAASQKRAEGSCVWVGAREGCAGDGAWNPLVVERNSGREVADSSIYRKTGP